MYIVWKKEDSTFVVDYYLETAERIQDNPITNADETHFSVGSSRVSQDALDILSLSHDIYYGEAMPEWWVDKV